MSLQESSMPPYDQASKEEQEKWNGGLFFSTEDGKWSDELYRLATNPEQASPEPRTLSDLGETAVNNSDLKL